MDSTNQSITASPTCVKTIHMEPDATNWLPKPKISDDNNNNNDLTYPNYISPLIQRNNAYDQIVGKTICRQIEFCLPKDVPNVPIGGPGEFLAAMVIRERMCSSNNEKQIK